MPNSNQSETIDPRILRLIGLEDVFDLDYETYLTLLKEAMVMGRMVKKTIPTEEIMLLDEEYKRVKTKKDKGRFKVKTKKITAKSFTIGGKQLPGGKSTKALPGTAIGKSSIAKSLDQNIAAITSSVVSIAEMMRQQAGLASEEAAYDRRRSEQQKRAVSENKLEKRFEGLKKAAEKIIAPVKGILDKIFGFLVKVFFGRVLYKLIEWFGDPKNVGKVKSVIRFLGDWWPALLGAYIIFGNSFGRFTTKIIFTVARFGVQLATKAIPGLIALARRNPATAALALGTTTYLTNQALNSSEPTQQLAGGGYVRPRRFRGGGLASLRRFFGLDGGGYPGYVSGQKGVDKIPAMLSDGEFVMSRGAVQMYGADTLSAMNAAGGGTNRPKIMGGTAYAQGGGPMGRMPNPDPNYKDPLLSARDRLMRELENYARSQLSAGGNENIIKAINNLSSSLRGQGTSNVSGGNKVPTGSLLTNPLGAIQRMTGMKGGGMKLPRLPSGKPKSKNGQPGFFQELQEKLTGSGAATYRDAGSIYAKQMLGGFGGPVSEMDLSKESRTELQKAIQRAKKRTGFEISKAEAKIEELRAQGAKDGNPVLETQKSFLKKLKSGGIRVQYTDYADEKGQMSESAKNAKNILGQFWAYGRDKKEGGGYRIEDKYDFDMFKKKDVKSGKMRDMNLGELLREGVFGKGKTVQQRLQAAYLLNPFRGKGDVDMVLGGKRTAAESLGLSASKTLLGGMLGISGNPQAKQARLAKPKPKTLPVKPPVRRTKADLVGSRTPRGRGSGRNTRGGSKPPRFNASTSGFRTKTQTLGLMR